MPNTLGLIGSGMIGSALARLATDAGWNVLISNSRGPGTLGDLVDELGPTATEVDVETAARSADIVVASIPFAAISALPAAALAGKTVVDTTNYYPDRDGTMAGLVAASTTSALVQEHLAQSHVVKAFNNVDFHHLATLARPAGSPERSGIPVAGNDHSAKTQVATLIEALGYNAVDIGTLADSWRSEPGTPVYVQPYLGTPPVDLTEEQNQAWFFSTPGTPVPSDRVRELVAEAVRPASPAIAGSEA